MKHDMFHGIIWRFPESCGYPIHHHPCQIGIFPQNTPAMGIPHDQSESPPRKTCTWRARRCHWIHRILQQPQQKITLWQTYENRWKISIFNGKTPLFLWPLSCVCIYPLVMTNIAIENVPVEIVDLPSQKIVIFHSYVKVYQRVPFCIIDHSISWVNESLFRVSNKVVNVKINC